MFNFLKNKLKIFEKKLEEEIESELAKETSTSDIKEKQTSEIKKDEHRQESLSPDKKTDESKIDYKKNRDDQIEKSIETELARIIQTRKGIESAMEPVKKSVVLTLDERRIDELLWDLEIGLLEADVAYSVIESIKKDIKEEIKHVPFDKNKAKDFIKNLLKHAISNVLSSNNFDLIEYIKREDKPVVIMFVGVNGTGKTLTIAKIANLLKKHNITCIMAAGDTFRAGAIEQLEIHAKKLDVKLIKHGPNADPAAVAYDAIQHAKAKYKDVVLLDTAGRMQTNVNLMDEMAKIKRVAKPNLIIFVGDALAGNDAVEQAKRFNEVVGIDGVILTKVDADAKGGSSLSIAYTIGKPLLYIGVGQGYDDQIPFDAEWMVNNIFEKE
ncbi:MAG: signal recognition particle-docking protein FtsY [Candidatus Thermoplasmatota archaeon]